MPKKGDAIYQCFDGNYGYLSVNIANINVFGKSVGDNMSGVMNYDELRTHFEHQFDLCED